MGLECHQVVVDCFLESLALKMATRYLAQRILERVSRLSCFSYYPIEYNGHPYLNKDNS